MCLHATKVSTHREAWKHQGRSLRQLACRLLNQLLSASVIPFRKTPDQPPPPASLKGTATVTQALPSHTPSAKLPRPCPPRLAAPALDKRQGKDSGGKSTSAPRPERGVSSCHGLGQQLERVPGAVSHLRANSEGNDPRRGDSKRVDGRGRGFCVLSNRCEICAGGWGSRNQMSKFSLVQHAQTPPPKPKLIIAARLLQRAWVKLLQVGCRPQNWICSRAHLAPASGKKVFLPPTYLPRCTPLYTVLKCTT